jgi:hypothetical protein
VGWELVTVTDVYTVHSLASSLEGTLLDRIGAAAIHGLRWYHARPPIDELDFEMDVRGVRCELYL